MRRVLFGIVCAIGTECLYFDQVQRIREMNREMDVKRWYYGILADPCKTQHYYNDEERMKCFDKVGDDVFGPGTRADREAPMRKKYGVLSLPFYRFYLDHIYYKLHHE